MNEAERKRLQDLNRSMGVARWRRDHPLECAVAVVKQNERREVARCLRALRKEAAA